MDRAGTRGALPLVEGLGKGRSFSTTLSRFSLRVDFGRTDCRQATANETELVGELEFDCCDKGPLHEIEVKMKPEKMPVSYQRPADPAARTWMRRNRADTLFQRDLGRRRTSRRLTTPPYAMRKRSSSPGTRATPGCAAAWRGRGSPSARRGGGCGARTPRRR